MKQVLVLTVALGLAGCAPRIAVMIPVPGGEPRAPRPPAEVMNEAAVTPRYGAGAITVSAEDRRWFARGCMLDVLLDGQPVAGLRPGQQVTLYAEPGRRVLSFNVRDEGSCEPGTASVAMQSVEHSTQQVRLVTSAVRVLTVEVNPYGRALPR